VENRISRVFDNVVERNFKERTENEVFVTDIRIYLQRMDSFIYQRFKICIIMKLSHGKSANEIDLVLDTLTELATKRNVYRSILYSDQGYQ
jgi:putative transposase